jgi:DNA-binding transcriptional ArsR family regulator
VVSTRRQAAAPPIEFPTGDQLQMAVETFGMLGDPTRLRILWVLLQGEQTVNRLAELVGVQQPAVSQHLAKLRMARLVRQRRDGSHVFYAVERKHVRPLLTQALSQAERVAQNNGGRSALSSTRNRTRLDRGLVPAVSGWTLNHGQSLPAASALGLAVNTTAVVGSIAIGLLLLAPINRLAGFLVDWLEPRFASARGTGAINIHAPGGKGSVLAVLALAVFAAGATLFDISPYDPTGSNLAWSPGAAVICIGAASALIRVWRASVHDGRIATAYSTTGLLGIR